MHWHRRGPRAESERPGLSPNAWWAFRVGAVVLRGSAAAAKDCVRVSGKTHRSIRVAAACSLHIAMIPRQLPCIRPRRMPVSDACVCVAALLGRAELPSFTAGDTTARCALPPTRPT